MIQGCACAAPANARDPGPEIAIQSSLYETGPKGTHEIRLYDKEMSCTITYLPPLEYSPT